MFCAYMQLFRKSNLNHGFTLLSRMILIIQEKSTTVKDHLPHRHHPKEAFFLLSVKWDCKARKTVIQYKYEI